jgi:hypothetical protein
MNAALISLTRLLNYLNGLRRAQRCAELDGKVVHYWVDDDSGLIFSEVVEYAPTDVELAEASTLPGAATYTKLIRGIARQVWRGARIDAFGLMWQTVGDGLTAAWALGAASCGIASAELTVDERIRRDMIIIEQRNYIFGFLEWVNIHRRDGENKLPWASINSRTNTWGNAWNKAYNEGKARACANQKLKWVLHGRRITKVSCVDCKKQNGRIYRASVWAKWQIFPQSFQLACKGFNCGCAFQDAGPDERTNRGRPPRLSGQ